MHLHVTFMCLSVRMRDTLPSNCTLQLGLLYNFVTSQKIPMESLELHRGCPWDSLRINWEEVTLTNGYSQIRLPYNVQVPLKEKTRLRNLMKGGDSTAHLMSQGPSRAPLGYTAQYHPPSLPCYANALLSRLYESSSTQY